MDAAQPPEASPQLAGEDVRLAVAHLDAALDAIAADDALVAQRQIEGARAILTGRR